MMITTAPRRARDGAMMTIAIAASVMNMKRTGRAGVAPKRTMTTAPAENGWKMKTKIVLVVAARQKMTRTGRAAGDPLTTTNDSVHLNHRPLQRKSIFPDRRTVRQSACSPALGRFRINFTGTRRFGDPEGVTPGGEPSCLRSSFCPRRCVTS